MMEQVTTTGTTATTIAINERGEQILDLNCWCGDRHVGTYAIEDWAMHHCTHSDPLGWLADDQLICGQCGQVFNLDEKPRAGAGTGGVGVYHA